MSKEIPDKVLNFDKAPEKEEKTLTKEILENQKELLPQPTGYRVLILPRGRDPVTKGGIQLAKETIGPWCKKGDWILFGRYAGARFRIEGGEMRLLNDDEILAMLPDPEAVDY